MLFKCSTKFLNDILCLRPVSISKCNKLPQNRRLSTFQSNSLFHESKLNGTKVLTKQLNYIIARHSSYSISGFVQRFFGKMDEATNARRAGVFCGEGDRFDGITVDSAEEYEKNMNFEQKLKKSIDYWVKHKRRAIWFRVHTAHSEWIPQLVKHNFDYHHAKSGFVTMRRWLPKDESENLPDYAHNLVGVGGLVINLEKMEVLVITDRFAAIPGSWKLPGGYVDAGENLVDAAIREVKEETGVNSIFRSMVSVRHAHGGSFGCSDLYFVVGLTPVTFDLHPCEREIARATWMPIADYLQHPNVHETNRHVMRTYLDYERRGLRFDVLTAKHQILKREYQQYYVHGLDEQDQIKVPTEEELEQQAVVVSKMD